MTANTPAIAIVDAETPGGLAFARSLGRLGLPVRVYSPRRLPVTRLSRFCTSFAGCPDPEDTDSFIPWLRAESRSGRIQLVAPTSDLIAFYIAEFPEAFPAEQQVQAPPAELTRAMLFKDRFDALCKSHALPTPVTHAPASKEEAWALADDLPYPIILKPKSHVGVGWARGQVVRSAAELRAHFAPYPTLPQRRTLMQRYPELAWPMLQEYVPEALKYLYSIGGILGPEGEVVAWAGSRKTLQWPPTLGVGVVFESWQEPSAVAAGLAFCQAVVKRGIFELELIFDARQGRYVAIDLNPRAHGHISFDIARGNDLPALWHRMSRGEAVAPQPAARQDVRWLHSVPYHVGHAISLVRAGGRRKLLQRYFDNLRGSTVDIINDRRDPLPSLAHLAYMFRNPGGLVRPFLREPF